MLVKQKSTAHYYDDLYMFILSFYGKIGDGLSLFYNHDPRRSSADRPEHRSNRSVSNCDRRGRALRSSLGVVVPARHSALTSGVGCRTPGELVNGRGHGYWAVTAGLSQLKQ